MSGSGQKAHPDVQEWSEDPPECPVVVGGPLGCPKVVGWPSRMSGTGLEALPYVREWSGDPLVYWEWSGSPSE